MIRLLSVTVALFILLTGASNFLESASTVSWAKEAYARGGYSIATPYAMKAAEVPNRLNSANMEGSWP